MTASPIWLTSASASILMAGGPTGMTIIANQRMGSLDRTDEFVAMAHIRGTLILQQPFEVSIANKRP